MDLNGNAGSAFANPALPKEFQGEESILVTILHKANRRHFKYRP
jgi:hypothetical protein